MRLTITNFRIRAFPFHDRYANECYIHGWIFRPSQRPELCTDTHSWSRQRARKGNFFFKTWIDRGLGYMLGPINGKDIRLSKFTG